MFVEGAIRSVFSIILELGDMGNFILSQTPVVNTDGAVFKIVPLIHKNST